MVDRADLAQAAILSEQIASIEAALDNLESGGRIVSMTIAGGSHGTPAPGMPSLGPRSAIISTVGMDYPQTMVDAIHRVLDDKRIALKNQLLSMGVTGEDLPPQPRSVRR